MLTNVPIQPSLATADLARARQWYEDKLGWQPTMEVPGLAAYEVGDSRFVIYETRYAHTAKNTVMNWNVRELRAEMARLRGRGVTFEEYDFGEFKTVDGVMTTPDGAMTAWFKDADGNIVSISQYPGGVIPGTLNLMLAASDLERAKHWYSDRLGYQPVEEVADVFATYRSGDSVFNLYQTQFAGTAQNTVGGWRVANVRAEVAELRAQGVVFEDYDFGDWKTVDGIADDGQGDVSAWFKDSEGNILAVTQERGAG